MNEEIAEKSQEITERLDHMWRYLDLASKQLRLDELERKMQEPSFWDDSAKAQKAIAESLELKTWLIPYHEMKQSVANIDALFAEVVSLGDMDMLIAMKKELEHADNILSELEVKRMLSKEMDKNSCYLTINAGAGGTEACDWALMLARMYSRWAAKKGFGVEILDTVDGDVAGVKSITYKISGPYAFGYARAERGVHRLVRISPFDSNAKRHTSFASVDVTPEVDDTIDIELRPDQMRIDTYRASGAGGQHVNKTDSAVRITHLPTGIVVCCQNERSQLQNKETCLRLLRAKLYDRERQQRAQQIEDMGGEKKEIAWGSQIRNYVFQPYTLVKDTRTKYEVGNVDAVIDGDIDPFIIAYLKEFG